MLLITCHHTKKTDVRFQVTGISERSGGGKKSVNYQKQIITNFTVRIDDYPNPRYKDRFNRGFPIKPGTNHPVLPFQDIVTTGTRRELEMEKLNPFSSFS